MRVRRHGCRDQWGLPRRRRAEAAPRWARLRPLLPGTASSCFLLKSLSVFLLLLLSIACLIRLARSHFLDCAHKNLRYYLGLRCAVASFVLNNLPGVLCSIHPCFGDGAFPLCCRLQCSEPEHKAVFCRVQIKGESVLLPFLFLQFS